MRPACEYASQLLQHYECDSPSTLAGHVYLKSVRRTRTQSGIPGQFSARGDERRDAGPHGSQHRGSRAKPSCCDDAAHECSLTAHKSSRPVGSKSCEASRFEVGRLTNRVKSPVYTIILIVTACGSLTTFSPCAGHPGSARHVGSFNDRGRY